MFCKMWSVRIHGRDISMGNWGRRRRRRRRRKRSTRICTCTLCTHETLDKVCSMDEDQTVYKQIQLTTIKSFSVQVHTRSKTMIQYDTFLNFKTSTTTCTCRATCTCTWCCLHALVEQEHHIRTPGSHLNSGGGEGRGGGGAVLLQTHTTF